MIGVIVGMALAIIVLVLVIGYMAVEMGDLRAEHRDRQDSEHAKCIAHIADITSKRVVAMVLRDLAHRWDSVEEKANLQRLSRKYRTDGPGLPAMWLNQQADLLTQEETPRG